MAFDGERDETLRKPTSQADTAQLGDPVTPDRSGTAIRLLDVESIAPFAAASEPDRYTSGPLLGAGGMGEVRSQVDRATGRGVAMKTMHAGADAIALRRFSREARIQSQLEHPSIVPVYDIGQTGGGIPFITMKHVRGDSLAHVITRLRAGDELTERTYTRRKLLTVLTTVAMTVEYAHQRGVIHRDLKPENIMLGPFGEVYVLDWGLAAIVAEHEKVTTASAIMRAVLVDKDEHASQPVIDSPGKFETATGLLLGTPGYIAPELLDLAAEGPAVEATIATDVYALGAILFEVLTTERMLRGESIGQLLGAATQLDGASPRERAPDRDVPPELDALCLSATRRDPAARPGSAFAFARTIEAFLDGDRDVAQRRALAAKVTDAAAAVLAQPDATSEVRSAAMRDVTIALGLDPQDSRARALLVRLLTEPPPDAAKLAEEVGRPAGLAAFRLAARTHLIVQTSYVFYLPLLAWMGIRQWWMLAVGSAAIGAVFAVTLYYYRHPPKNLQLPLVHLAISMLALATGAFLFGPLILVPGIVVATGVAYLASFERRVPWIVAAMLACVLVPTVLELTGVIPSSYEFVNGELHVVPMMTDLPPVPTATLLVITHAIVIASSLYFAWRLRRAYVDAANALRLQAWQLAQLVPADARPELGDA